MKQYKVKLQFTEPLLGTVPKDPEVYKNYIAKYATEEGTAEEVETVQKAEESGWTGFHLLDGNPILYDYVIKGFFKDAAGMLRRASDTHSSKLKAYKKVIDGLVFISPRRIPIGLNGGEMGVLERPLRAQTAQGERVALARSDSIPPGASIEFTITVLGEVKETLLREWLEYGQLRGLGQWRNGGYGSFEYEMEAV